MVITTTIIIITIIIIVIIIIIELVLQDYESVGEVIKTKQPTALTVGTLPASYDLRPLGLLTQDLNQHIPQVLSLSSSSLS